MTLQSMAVRQNSVLVPAEFLGEDQKSAMIYAAEEQVALAAKKHLSEFALTLRDLIPTDLGMSNDAWNETHTATDNAYQDSAISSKSVGDEKFIVVYGVQDFSTHNVISKVRFDVGGSKVAQIDLSKLWAPGSSRTGFLLGPLIFTQNAVVTMEVYPRQGASADGGVFSSQIQLLGILCERDGTSLKA